MENFESLGAHVPAGTILFSEGEHGDTGYFIESGTVDVLIRRDGMDVSLVKLGAGELVGELAMFDPAPRSATATALTDCVLVKFDRYQVINRINTLDPVMRRLMHTLVDRLRATNALITKNFGTGEDSYYEKTPAADGPHNSLENLKLEIALKNAIEENQLELFFQPIIELSSMKLAGFEGLIRWNHPEKGLIRPDSFVSLAEKSGLIFDMTKSALKATSEIAPEFQLAATHNPYHVEPLFLTVNITGRDIGDPTFARTVEEMLSRSSCIPSMLKLEITESYLVDNMDRAKQTLNKFAQLGIGIAIDDFGTGHSNLSSLIEYPMSTLKIDRSFITSKLTQHSNRKVVSMILALANELGADVVAEGIEHTQDLEALRQLNCRYGQGYYFSKPMPSEEALDFVRNWKSDIASDILEKIA